MQKPWRRTDRANLGVMGHLVIQAPMAGAGLALLAIAAARGGALGSIACAALTLTRVEEQVSIFRNAVSSPLNMNFFCHVSPDRSLQKLEQWETALAGEFSRFEVSSSVTPPFIERMPFDDAACSLVERLRPELVSFHFGLPEAHLLQRVKECGATVVASATSVREAIFLEQNGCDYVIAQGAEAGGHRGNFLEQDMSRQSGLFSLLPQVVDAVKVPVIAAGGIADGRGIAAALALGASAVQIGTAYLLTNESTIGPAHRARLDVAEEADTQLTNVFTGRPARGLVTRLMTDFGPLAASLPDFPLAGATLAKLLTSAAARDSGDFQPLWAGQSASMAKNIGATALTLDVLAQAEHILATLRSG